MAMVLLYFGICKRFLKTDTLRDFLVLGRRLGLLKSVMCVLRVIHN
jgi:hypothetical protein